MEIVGTYKKVVDDKITLEVVKREGEREYELRCPAEGWRTIGFLDKGGEQFFGAFSYNEGSCGFHHATVIGMGLLLKGGYSLNSEWEVLWYKAAGSMEKEKEVGRDPDEYPGETSPLLTEEPSVGETPQSQMSQGESALESEK